MFLLFCQTWCPTEIVSSRSNTYFCQSLSNDWCLFAALMIFCSWDTEWDRQNFLSFWAIFCSFIPLMILKIKTLTQWKKMPGDIIFLHMCAINENRMMYGSWNIRHNRIFCYVGPFFAFSHDAWFLRYGVQQTDGQTDRWKRWHIEVGAPPKKYCPVSLLFMISEVFEKLVNNKIVDHLEKCGLFSDFSMVLGLLNQLQIFWQLHLIELLGF